jgi:hypothetical protein
MDQEPLNILIGLPSSPYPVTSAAGISQASANSTCLEMSLSPSMEHPNEECPRWDFLNPSWHSSSLRRCWQLRTKILIGRFCT